MKPLPFLLALLAAASLLGRASAGEPFDLILRGGRVIDGTGNPSIMADVAVKDGRIVQVGRVDGAAEVEIDARGLVVAPGFIDVHTHSESVASTPKAENFIRMGVTSIVTGNCGGSAENVREFFERIERTGVALNVATLYGHNTARREAMGGSFDRLPTPEELGKMRELVEQGMRDGAVGLSTGLIYLPGTFSHTEEIIEIAKVAAKYDGIYASHMRNEANSIMDSLTELFRISREAGIRAEISHIKLSGNSAWGRTAEVLGAIERARAEGLEITQDQYVYPASSTGISTLIPTSAREGSRDDFQKRIEDPVRKARIVADMKARLRSSGREDFSYAFIASYRTDSSLNGKNMRDAAKIKRGSDSLDDQIELILEIEKNGGAGGIFHGMSEDDLQIFLQHPNTMFASDGGPREGASGVPHPRSYGNNARVLGRYVRDLKLLRLEEAVRKMSSLPATAFRLRDRGAIREGAWADIVVFDPNTVRDVATFGDPHHHAEGFRHVLVNGQPVIRDWRLTDARPGKALRLWGVGVRVSGPSRRVGVVPDGFRHRT
jgi:N-acyl-D-amino-acid deacylase